MPPALTAKPASTTPFRAARALAWAAPLLVALAGAAAAQEKERVDLELVLLADASGSIDPTEAAMQRQGYADAMVHPEVLWAISNGGALGRIAVTFVEWAGAASQDVVVDWMVIDGEASARDFGARLMAAPRRAYGSNAIGSALLEGARLIESNAYEGGRKVIDLSGDSGWNPQGPPIATARDAVLGAEIVINGLAILCDDCSGRPRAENLEQIFQNELIGGPGAFVVTADDRDAFALAVRRKLILEISALDPAILAAPPDPYRVLTE
ncbi:MAG: hypothetical protein DI556_16570 [Rhodovulum sulfidophilum]|uniref:DUF1194 domain-containing protein n=1 Tax=Rhodovulum sulfidophilum TaxID=35806 RepID=A0A2W5N2U5_RHOSU|nr:MAG: hypothetical protein DI556_16570 [Rhodovulum sulfidophilum]